ncbi:hypothetical protein E2562_019178 [Oryza meyeriana var. granulata]|uniref:Uncharacterized protein n=1 Tax=Oryza meyeriana var. granulata TaxID=110450 RepID=A0A6G1F9Z7_9ORYZ|nr:hypothetical protein E2562_019178 [Oryza meyeriana var. granulata]
MTLPPPYACLYALPTSQSRSRRRHLTCLLRVRAAAATRLGHRRLGLCAAADMDKNNEQATLPPVPPSSELRSKRLRTTSLPSSSPSASIRRASTSSKLGKGQGRAVTPSASPFASTSASISVQKELYVLLEEEDEEENSYGLNDEL